LAVMKPLLLFNDKLN